MRLGENVNFVRQKTIWFKLCLLVYKGFATMEYKRGMDDTTMSDRKSLIPGPLRTFCTKTRAARTSYRRKRSLNFTGFIHFKERLNESMTK